MIKKMFVMSFTFLFLFLFLSCSESVSDNEKTSDVVTGGTDANDKKESPAAETSGESGGDITSGEGGEGSSSEDGKGSTDTGCSGDSSDTGASGSEPDEGVSDGSSDAGSSDGSSDGSSNGGDSDDNIPQAGQLTAGEWSDLENWDFWKKLVSENYQKQMEEYWGFYTLNRYSVLVENNGKPLVDADVVLKDDKGEIVWRAKSNNTGQAELFAGLFAPDFDMNNEIFTIVATYNGVEAIAENVEPQYETPIVVNLDVSEKVSNTLDLMFVFDTTGSMGDELDFLKSEMADVINNVKKDQEQNLKIRLSCNYYRDEGDEYVVRSFPFSENIDSVVKQLKNQSHDGGGDYPEAVEKALENAVFEHDWSENAIARLMFLVLDAPPHHTDDIILNIHDTVKKAAELGITIIPVASSGVDKETEFLLRFLNIATNGTYVFLTDHSGIGNSHIEPTIGDYDVELLNKLIIRLINEKVSVKK